MSKYDAMMSMIVIGALWVLNAPLSLCLNRTGCCACCARFGRSR